MRENVGGNGGKTFLMFLLGTAAGAVGALLLAPSSGKETRKRLRDALQQAGEKAASMAARAESHGREDEAVMMKPYEEEPSRSSHEGARTGSGSPGRTAETTPVYPPTTPSPATSSSSSSRSGQSYTKSASPAPSK